MEIPLFLAISQQEMASCTQIPENLAWLGCHCSETAPELTGFPIDLPEKSFLIIDDSVPLTDHAPERIVQQVEQIVANFGCTGILLDFQRPPQPRSIQIVNALLALPYPVGVAEPYAKGLDCPIFLPPIPPTVPPEEYLKPWQGQEIWLDLSYCPTQITVTATGSRTASLPRVDGMLPLWDERLCCHYRIEKSEGEIRFVLQRTKEDLTALLNRCATHGVTLAFGLYQELEG